MCARRSSFVCMFWNLWLFLLLCVSGVSGGKNMSPSSKKKNRKGVLFCFSNSDDDVSRYLYEGSRFFLFFCVCSGGSLQVIACNVGLCVCK